jgi:hypothetical protein
VKTNGSGAPARIDELGYAREPLCREPWESYYILRRGILPCCYGSTPIAPMAEWREAWNSPAIQEIRRHLVNGDLSPYCLASLGCPVVQRFLEEKRKAPLGSLRPSARPPALRFLNRALGGIPGAVYRALRASPFLRRRTE